MMEERAEREGNVSVMGAFVQSEKTRGVIQRVGVFVPGVGSPGRN